MDGILNLDKPPGITSHDVVQQVRRMVREKRVGHTGTLDPLATGVLVVCVGKATRIAQYLEAGEKEYTAVLRLGVTTETLDRDGRVLQTRAYAPPERSTVLSVLQSFTGRVMQTPPAYSAVKVGGVPSYKLARRGKAPVLAPRPVTIRTIDLSSYDDPFVTIRVVCSKGVYIRTLCADVGEALGTGAHLLSLVRNRSGDFTIEDALTLDKLGLMTEEEISRSLVPVDSALAFLPAITVGPDDSRKIIHGNGIHRPAGSSLADNARLRIYSEDGRFLAVGRTAAGEIRPELVFSD